MTGQLRTIVLDTSPTTRKVLEVILHREGHQVACFDASLEALRALSRQGRADLLFLGLDLPKMDGFDVLKRLRGEPRFHSTGSWCGSRSSTWCPLTSGRGLEPKNQTGEQGVPPMKAVRWPPV